MFDTIDKYKLNLYCTCLSCNKRKQGEKAHSCAAFPDRNGIPAKVWNEENAKCEHYEPKHPE